ncbi:NADH-quinone oxidoreductase subunit N [Haloarchaeobius iranensis]|uniref:NADH dehydrogenase subunit N n=1 Tax=Haloarchaeobius iranensis TaxID=996166 RepID=A0A1G9WJ47_9EURY|nr:NADH-quinone oxidoreductase subunit N [Haloarchaeobius iranensis]SDM84558.1 NADH dehydrogenase subunit N [Haloarchaeobius iranensis]
MADTTWLTLAPAFLLGLTGLLVLYVDSIGHSTKGPIAVLSLLGSLGVAGVAIALPDVLGLGPAGWSFVSVTLLAMFALALFVEPGSQNRRLIAGLSTAGAVGALGVAAAFLFTFDGEPVNPFGDALVVDGMSLFFAVIVASVTAMVTVASYNYIAEHSYQAEYYALVLLAATGMTLMASANSLVTVFVALELASLPSYALVAFLKENKGSVEAGLKYFLVGALSSAVFAYGVSLVYGATGSLQLTAVQNAVTGEFTGMLGMGVVMVVGGIAFKTASVPFHFWAPEAYEGAPAPISAFLSSASKAAGFVIAFRVFTEAFLQVSESAGEFLVLGADWVLVFQILAVVTMTLGNLAAVTQDKVKRMLAYSSVGHAGYVLMSLAALSGGGATATAKIEAGQFVLAGGMMHLFVYGFMNTGAFLFIALAEYWDVGRTFEDFTGLGRQAPVASVAMTVFMFSLAGLPPFGGFLSKYLLFGATVNSGFVWLAAVAIVNSAVSLYYYSKLVKALWFDERPDDKKPLEISSRPTGLYAAVIFAAVVTTAMYGVFGPVSDAAVEAAAALL